MTGIPLGGQVLVTACGMAALEAIFLWLHHLGNLKIAIIPAMTAFLAAGIIYFIALFALEHTSDRRVAVWIIVGGALLFRLTLLPLPPSLSDDLYRYRFDGRTQLAGWNPYSQPPDDPRLAAYLPALAQPIPGHDIPSIYPPLAELTFRETARYSPGIVGFKLPFAAADFFTVLLLAWWLRHEDGRNYQLAVYAWSPLVIVEFASSSHGDAMAILALVAACVIIRSRPTLSTMLLGAAVLFKAFPILLFPVWLRRQGWPGTVRSWVAAGSAAAIAALSAWPYRAVLWKIPETIRYYASHWENNYASLYAVLLWMTHSPRLATWVGVLAAVSVALWTAWRGKSPERAAFLVVGTILLFSPNAYSWYFTWIVPFLCFFPSVAWLLLTVLIFLSYHVLVGYGILGAWHFEPKFIWMTYAPFYAVLLWQFFRNTRATPNSSRMEMEKRSARR